MSLANLARYGLTRATAGPPPPATELGAPSVYEFPDDTVVWDDSASTLDEQFGYRFTPQNDVSVGALRMYNDSALTSDSTQTETVRIWRISTEELITSAIVEAGDGWGETAVTPVTLLSGVEYAITRHAGGASRIPLRGAFGNGPTNVKLDGSLTLGANIGTSGATFPSATTGGTPRSSVAFRSVAPEAGYRFLRLNVLENNGNSTIRVMNIQYRDEVAGANKANTTRPSFVTNESASFPWVNVFSGTTSFWITENAVVTAVGYHDFGSGNEISLAQYTIQAHSNVGARTALPRDWQVEGSNDFVTWDVLDSRADEGDWSTSETRTYTL